MLQRIIALQILNDTNIQNIAAAEVLLGHLIFRFLSVSIVKHAFKL